MTGYKISAPPPLCGPPAPSRRRLAFAIARRDFGGLVLLLVLLLGGCLVLTALRFGCNAERCGQALSKGPPDAVMIVPGVVALSGALLLEGLGSPHAVRFAIDREAGEWRLLSLGLPIVLGVIVWSPLLWAVYRGLARLWRFWWRPPPVQPSVSPYRVSGGAGGDLSVLLYLVVFVLYQVVSGLESGFSWARVRELTVAFGVGLPLVLLVSYLSSGQHGHNPTRTERLVATSWLLFRRVVAFTAALAFGLLALLAFKFSAIGGILLLVWTACLIWFGWIGSGSRNDTARANLKAHERRKKRYGW